MLEDNERDFIAQRRTATLVTRSGRGVPRPVPICFVLGPPRGDEGGAVLYTPLDEKPKRSPDPRALARVRDILADPEVALLFERWSEDWAELAWLRAYGRASLLEPGADRRTHARAVSALREKYVQYRVQHIEDSPLIRITIDETTMWSATPELVR